MKGKLYINNIWVEGEGEPFQSLNPMNKDILWHGKKATETQIEQAIHYAKEAFTSWSNLSIEKRIAYLKQFQDHLTQKKAELAEIISKEMGKPLWESIAEVGGMINKIPISLESYHERCKTTSKKTSAGSLKLNHKPHGVVAVFGPFNFPGHLPQGHIIPALLAGNTIVFKPSELTPLVAEKMIEYWQDIRLPKGVINLIQGDGETGKLLSEAISLDGLLFTGSYKVGSELSAQYGKTPEKIIALEMGGNNPLVVHDIPEHSRDAAVYQAIQSAYITAGQRCTCARRLIVTQNALGKAFVERFIDITKNIKRGAYWEKPEPFMGPVVSEKAALKIINATDFLLDKGGKAILELKAHADSPCLLSPALIDVTNITRDEDEEIFGPVLQLYWVPNLEAAVKEAKNTQYGLAAGIFCPAKEDYEYFYREISAGVINWNKSTTGASSELPFGGVGKSGNHRPSAFYAADYCAYPVASMEEELKLPGTLVAGISF